MLLSTLILAVTTGVSLFTLYRRQDLIERLMLKPYFVFRKGEWHTLVTHGFVHADFMHLLFNMFTLFFFARYVEMMYGAAGFAAIYFGAMIVASLPTLFEQRDNPGYATLGASAGVAGVLFSSIVTRPMSTIQVFFIPMPAIAFGVLYMVYSYFAHRNPYDNINHLAHLWGAVTGILLTVALDPMVRQIIGERLGL